MLSARNHPEVVMHYLQSELQQGRLVCPLDPREASSIPARQVELTVFIPINAVAFILFKSVVGGGIYWRAVSLEDGV